MLFSRVIKVLLIVIVAFVFASVGTAFAAANTVPDGYAGEGAGAVSGYTVSNVQYHLNSTTPSSIDSVSFDLNAAAGTVMIKLVAGGSTFYTCTTGGGNHWSCATAGATVTPTDELTVIATQ